MANISQRLEQTLRSAIQKNPILPIKTVEGILVGDVLIVSDGPIKHIKKNGEIVYKEISLNCVAISLANLLAKNNSNITMDKIYAADQEYGRWFVDSQMLRANYEKALNNKDYERADMFWARYKESRARTQVAKNLAESLAAF